MPGKSHGQKSLADYGLWSPKRVKHALATKQQQQQKVEPNLLTSLASCFSGCSVLKQELGFDPWVRKIPWKRKWQPTLIFSPGKSCGRRSLASNSPWGRKESNRT